jgi:O-succinylbenzoate synthase
MSTPLVELFQYDLPLAIPLRLNDQVLMRRTGLILKFGYGERETGYGEIAPLPGFSRETLEEAKQIVIRWSDLLGGLPKTEPEREQALGFMQAAPSVLFGTECALCSFRHAIGSPLSLGLFSRRRTRVSINGLLMGPREEVVEKARRLAAEGYRAVKLKVGARDIEEDIETVRQVRNAIGNAMALRLDANRAWDRDTALAFARAVGDRAIEYIEEPLAEPQRLEEFARRSGLPVALDETLREQRPARGYFRDKQWARAAILKPTLHGGVMHCEQLAYEALEFGVKPVVSSCFESGLGIAALAHFASTITAEDVPAGLDTGDWFAEDILATRFQVRNGALDIDELDACVATLKIDTLERVYSG